MRGARGGRQQHRHPAPERRGADPEETERPQEGAGPTGGTGSRGGYLDGAYPASPPPADAPVTGPDPDSADPYYRRPDYPTDPGGVPLPDLTGESAPSPD
ncbi:MAG TPA: hypothetical protein VK060_16915 [Ruania sp.]|nr:hypothetical protein [Ruania sp.]